MLTYEADQRHADLLIAEYGLTASSKAKAIPWDKAAFLARHPLAETILGREATSRVPQRCLYLALDRPDIQFTAKEISRAMASPTVHADETLKALLRYLAGHPRVLWRYPRQEWTGKVWGLTDSNWAACPVTRKSSSATYLMLGKHPIFAASSTQTISSLSSGEVSRSCAVCLSNVGVEESHVGFVTGGQVRAGNGQLCMQGVVFQMCAGKIRHIHCPTLWLQHAVARRQIAITRRAGKDFAPDVGTKAGIPGGTMW